MHCPDKLYTGGISRGSVVILPTIRPLEPVYIVLILGSWSAAWHKACLGDDSAGDSLRYNCTGSSPALYY